MGIRHPLSIPRGRTIDIVMKVIFAATIIALSVAYAHSITCYQCPYGILPNEKCLNDGSDPGKEHNCLNPLDNACETLAIDDPAASLHYNRRCAHKPFNHGWDVIIPQSASKEKEIMMEEFATAKMIFAIPRCRQNSYLIQFDTYQA